MCVVTYVCILFVFETAYNCMAIFDYRLKWPHSARLACQANPQLAAHYSCYIAGTIPIIACCAKLRALAISWKGLAAHWIVCHVMHTIVGHVRLTKVHPGPQRGS